MTPRPAAYRRILITRMKFIGDIVLTTPLLRSVRNACPGAFLAYLGDAAAVSLLEGNPCLDEIIPFDFGRPTWYEQPRVTWLLRRREFDLAIDLFGNPRSALLTYLSGARFRVGPDRKGRGRLYSVRVADDGLPKSAIAFHNQSLQAAGIQPTAERTEIFLGEPELQAAAAFLSQADEQGPSVDVAQTLVGIHPGATWPAKMWLPNRFSLLANRLRSEMGIDVVLTAGRNDDAVVDQVRKGITSPVRVVRGLPLRQLAAVLGRFSAYVANDCGPMHISVAVGTPTIGIFGPGEENIWFPYRGEDGHHALRKDVLCHPCHLDVCNRSGGGHMECMKKLDVDEVIEAVRRSLSAGKKRVRVR